MFICANNNNNNDINNNNNVGEPILDPIGPCGSKICESSKGRRMRRKHLK